MKNCISVKTRMRKQPKRLGIILGIAVFSAALGTGAAGEEAAVPETETVAEVSVPQPEIAVPEIKAEPPKEVPAPQNEVRDEPPAATEPVPEPAPAEPAAEPEPQILALSAESGDGTVEVTASKPDGSSYSASDGIRITEKDGTEERSRLTGIIADRYRQEHAEINWNDANSAALAAAASEAVRTLRVYVIGSADGSPFPVSGNSVRVTVKDTGILKDRDGNFAATVFGVPDMTENGAATGNINAEGHSFTVEQGSMFAVAVLQDVSFTPEPEPEPETEAAAEPQETAETEPAETPETEIPDETEQPGGEETESEPQTEAETSAGTEEQAQSEPAPGDPVPENPDGTGAGGETEQTAPPEEETENGEERELPVHPEVLDFDDREKYPSESVDGPSPLAAETADTPAGTASDGAAAGETSASEFAGLSNAEAAEKCLELVRRVDNSGIVPSVVTAQMILESGYVRTGLAQNANNCFGMKSTLSANEWTSTWGGQSVNYQTWEQNPDGSITTPVCSFRVYDNIEQSILDHSGYLLEATNGGALRYPGVAQSRDYETVAAIIKAGGYATDINYVPKLCSIIRTYNLDRYDADTPGRAGTSSGTETASTQMK